MTHRLGKAGYLVVLHAGLYTMVYKAGKHRFEKTKDPYSSPPGAKSYAYGHCGNAQYG